MRPFHLFLALFFLFGCHSTKKTVNREKTKQASLVKGVSLLASGSDAETALQAWGVELSQSIKAGRQLSKTIRELYRPDGTLRERTTTLSTSQSRERRQSGSAAAKSIARSASEGSKATAMQVKATAKQSDAFHKAVKRRGMGFWFQLSAGLSLVLFIALLVHKRNSLQSRLVAFAAWLQRILR